MPGSNNQPIIINNSTGSNSVPFETKKFQIVKLPNADTIQLSASDIKNNLIINPNSGDPCYCTFPSYDNIVLFWGNEFKEGLSWEMSLLCKGDSERCTHITLPCDDNVHKYGQTNIVSSTSSMYNFQFVVAEGLHLYILVTITSLD